MWFKGAFQGGGGAGTWPARHQSAQGALAPSSRFPVVGPAGMLPTSTTGFTAQLPAPRLLSSLLAAASAALVAFAKCGEERCQKAVSRRSKTLKLNAVPYTWWSLHF